MLNILIVFISALHDSKKDFITVSVPIQCTLYYNATVLPFLRSKKVNFGQKSGKI